ncbi:hypothetical protein CPC08DRAFT_823782 [Agrocybe pediades]|nr:hypothetical protein CPC08DRAFT_823782 [Agrocybe pediades]
MQFTAVFFLAGLLQAALPLAMGAATGSAAANRVQACCDVVIPMDQASTGSRGTGINCYAPGFDCGFALQMTASCARVTQGHTGLDCVRV